MHHETQASKIARRTFLAAALAGLAPTSLRAEPDAPLFRVGVLPFGSVQWEIETIRLDHLDKLAGLRVEAVPLASTEAARTAFLSGSVDAIVQDLLFAARLKAEGRSVLFLPQSSTEGELLVPAASPVSTLADLKGKTIGVAGGPLDKNWLFLRAAALREAKLDLSKQATAIFGAAPLLAAKLERGELDCGLLYWGQGARLAAKGYRRIASTEGVLRDLGAKVPIAVGGYLFDGSAKRPTLIAFREALRTAQRRLADKPEAWDQIRPLMNAPDQATFEALRHGYVRGVPRKGRADEIADARAFFGIVKSIGGGALLGPVNTLPDNLYVDAEIYG